MSEQPLTTAERYRRFAIREARGSSPWYERLALGIADAPDLLTLIDQLPERKRQANLVFASTRFLGAEHDDFTQFHTWFVEHWSQIREVALQRSTQTNEIGRCAALLPALTLLPQPLALIEVGASAGLCLYPDRYRYTYDTGTRTTYLGNCDAPHLYCEISGPVPVPETIPTIAWRAGIDLNPLSVTDDDAMRWLRCLVWPEQEERRRRLDDAIEIAQTEPIDLVQGDLNEKILEVIASAPRNATVVVFHSAVLAYLTRDDRQRFAKQIEPLPIHWLSNEGPGVMHDIPVNSPVSTADGLLMFIIALDGQPRALSSPHGQRLHWLD